MRLHWCALGIVWFSVGGLVFLSGCGKLLTPPTAPVPAMAVPPPPLKLTAKDVVIGSNGVVSFKMHNVGTEHINGPIHFLVTLLKQYPKANNFEIEWSYAVGGSGSMGKILYDLKKASLTYHQHSYWAEGDNGEDKHFVYNQVTPKTLNSLTKKLVDIQGYEKMLENLDSKGAVLKQKITKPFGKP